MASARDKCPECDAIACVEHENARKDGRSTHPIELLETAKSVLSLVDHLDQRWGGKTMHDEVMRLRAAIAKAEQGGR